jgi:hypothetical protein
VFYFRLTTFFERLSMLRNQLTVCVLLLSAVAQAQDKADEKATKVETKGVPRTSAATVDFQNSLGLSFDSLASLGTRIEHCRTAADPVGLAAAAKELAVAEAVSGKKATVTSDAISKEAIELAKLRNSSQELSAVAYLSGDDAAADLKKAAAAAKQAEADRASALAAGEEPKGDHHFMHVHNHHAHPVQIYHNGYHSGYVPAHGHFQFQYYGHQHHFHGYTPSHHFHYPAQTHHGHAHWHLH